MEINQYKETGDGFIKFSEDEIKIIKEKGRLTFTTAQMKEFANILMHTAVSIFKRSEEAEEKNK